jgi:hypothetical protein
LYWAVESGNLEAAWAILDDLLTFRADRDRYYFGVDDLFNRHRDIVKILCERAIDLVPKMLTALIWRSRVTEGTQRRVNYYVKHLIINPDGNFKNALKHYVSTNDPKLMCHPVIVLVADLLWSKAVFRTFLFGWAWFIFTLMVFVTSQSILEHNSNAPPGSAERGAVFGCRLFMYSLTMVHMIYKHIRKTCIGYKRKDTFKMSCFRFPAYLKQWQESCSLFLTLSLIMMCCLEPVFWCWSYSADKMFDEYCAEEQSKRFAYTVFAMFAMFLYFILLLDLSVMSTRICAFVLVCVKMMTEVGLFLVALGMAVLTFSSAMSVLKQDNVDFAGIHKGAYSLLRMSLGTYSATRFEDFHGEPVLLVVIIVFLLTTVVFLLNMLIAQLSCAYSSVYTDMVGYARLKRADTIVELMPSVPKSRWNWFVGSLRLDQRLEFNQGDIGIVGGIQVKEAANLNPTTVDRIKRFGGSTSPENQWPAETEDADGEDKFERMEKLLQRTLQRLAKSSSHSKGSRGGSTGPGTGTGTGSKQEGSGGSDASAMDDEDAE